MVIEVVDVFGGNEMVNFGPNIEPRTSVWRVYNGSSFDSGTSDTNLHVIQCVITGDGTNTIFSVDGSSATGDAGTSISSAMSQIKLADANPVNVGEILTYPQDKRSIFGDIRSYFKGRWPVP